MKEHVEFITDSFTDFAGKVHYFVIAALSQTLPTSTGQLRNNPTDYNNISVIHKVGVYVGDYECIDYLGDVSKVLRLGISICNPVDTFDEKIGSLKAIARARNAEPALYTNNPGIINTKMVKALLEQEATYLKSNPENFIAGYADARDKYFANKRKEEMKNSFSDLENQIIENTKKNPNFLDNVLKFLGICH